ncbi:glycosyl hydrolase [Streptomyces sp. NBC_00006]|uniref:glycosyl hydrolase n=1 Tax=Streptomyces sp. NBC_00006 TaxID=2975619 RepID=UPI00224D37B7|nr:glycosyl hydrolase [Streptomyces sp. NBC_00006]MCX5529583.1 glycosyl hydrolase [Streptomyces sp. NBC_00006]
MDQDLTDLFDNPPAHNGPVPLWWWSGGPVTRERVRWQLERFVQGAIHDVVLMNLAPKGPTYGAQPDDPPWFSERWWDLVTYTCDVADELGVRLWFYDQIGFSGANVQGTVVATHPEAAGRVLRTAVTEVGEDGTLPLAERDHVVGVYGDRAGDGWQRLDVRDGRVDAAPGTRIRVVTWRDTAFDYLDPHACALLLDAVHGEFERRLGDRLGNVITGSFQDELPAMPTWSARFAAEFERRRGYDLLDHLPSLWERGGDADDAVRADYHLVRTELAEEAFFRPLGEWHERWGMLVGADQTNPARAGWPTQSSQLYGDYFTTHRWINAVGSDHEGDARVHSSMADLYGHPRVWIESFHSSGWGGTLEDTWDWLLPFFRSGADLYNPHAAYLDTRAGWFEWAPPGTDFRQPYYAVYPSFARAVARTSALLTWGDHVVDVGVLYPSTTGHAELAPDEPIDYFGEGPIGGPHERADRAHITYQALTGTNNWFRHTPSLLDRAGIDFDVVDEDSLHRAKAGDGKLRVGALGFRTVLLPSVTHLRPGTAEQLVALLDAGGQVVVVGADPVTVTGRDSSPALAALVEHPKLIRADTPEQAVRLTADAGTPAWAPHGLRARRRGDVTAAFVPAAEPNATAYPLRQDPDSLHWDEIDFDPGRYAARTHVDVAGPVAEAEVWNPATGERRPAPIVPSSAGSRIEVDLAGAPAVFVVWRAGERRPEHPAQPAAATPAPPVVEEPLDDGWTHELVPTLDNTWGDMALPAGPDDVPLEVWRMRWRDGEAEPVDVRATFGQQVLVHGPSATPPGPLGERDAERVRQGAELADPDWQLHRFSASRGLDTDHGHRYEPKGFVPEEFLVLPAPGEGEHLSVRTVLRVEEPGPYLLTVAAPAAKQVWFDGVPCTADGDRYATTMPVRFSGRTAVLEYRVGAGELPATVHGNHPETLGSWFMLERPQQHVERPEFIAPGQVAGGEGDVRTRFRTSSDADGVTLVTGSTAALRIELDSVPVARQEKVQYYENDAGDRPMFFTHHLGPLPAGEHELRVVAETADSEHAVSVDALVHGKGLRQTVVSGPEWTSGADGPPARVKRGLGAGLTHTYTARRPHPLPDAAWLTGRPEVGEPAVRFSAARSAAPRLQEFEVLLPAGAVEASLPVPVESAELAGAAVSVEAGRLTLDRPLDRPATLIVRTAPRAFDVGGAAWDGPVVVRTESFVGPFEDWRDAGLGAWSGAVRSTRSIHVAERERVRLDLGRVRGAVVIAVDDNVVGELFCSPFALDLGELAPGEHRLTVTVYGSLAPRLDSISPTHFLRPSQLHTGVRGPVRLTRRSVGGDVHVT